MANPRGPWEPMMVGNPVESFKAYYYGRYRGGQAPLSQVRLATRPWVAPRGPLWWRLLKKIFGPSGRRATVQTRETRAFTPPRQGNPQVISKKNLGPKPSPQHSSGRILGRLALWVTPVGLLTLSIFLLRSPVFTQDATPAEGLRVVSGEIPAAVKKSDRIESAEGGSEFIKLSDIGELTDEAGNEIDLETFNPYRHPDATGTNRPADLARRFTVHKVRSGDTLWSLARRFRVSADTLVTLNRLTSAHRLNPGDTLKIPPYSGVFYEVRRGDTVESVARTFGVDEESIRQWNELGPYLPTGANLFLKDARLPSTMRGQAYGVNFTFPVRGSITSTYGMRVHPILQRPIFHSGIDIGAAPGERVTAAEEGTVTFAGENGHYGNLVVVRHPSGYDTAYGHLLKVHTRQGQKVKRGECVGEVGSTGLSTGPHLHFEVRFRGQFLNPLRFLTGAQVAMAAAR